jgi:type IV pilus assembly protein PilQ
MPDYTLQKIADTQLKLTLFNTKLPDYRERPLITTGFESAVDRVVPYTDAGVPDQTYFTIEMRESVPYYVEQKGNQLMVHFEASSVPAKAPAAELTLTDQKVVVELPATKSQPAVAAAPVATAVTVIPAPPTETTAAPAETLPKYTGEKIALDFYETDIKNVFRILQTVSGLNFAIDKDVTGQVTLSFDEPVPWDQVLDLILKMNQLDKKMEGNIVRIATLSTLKKEESDRQAALLAEQKSKEQELALEPIRTEYIAVNYSNAGSEVLPHIQNILTEGRGSANVDERSNLIVITDTDRVIAQAKTIVKRLDRVTPQVIIEARVVEVNSDVSTELGISWSTGQDGVVSDMLGGTYGWDLAMNFPAASTSGVGFEFARVSGTPFVLDAKLNALETESRGKVISAPKVVTMDNKKATIKQGQEIGYYERDDSGGSSTAFKNVDLLLEVTPHVTPDNRVSMTVYITKNDLAGTFNNAPLLSTNEAETEFLVNDGETIVIGGILKKTETTGQEGFPVLKDIPGLGWLFQTKTSGTVNSELLIFITPKIVTLEQKEVE